MSNPFLLSNEPGNLDKVVSNTLYGFNHSNHIPALPESKDKIAYIFFTRPQLNLSTKNIRNVRQFYSLMDRRSYSTGSFVRATLDPRLQFKGEVYSSLVDQFQAFIPVLTNTISVMSGWPDMVSPVFVSQQGIRKEQIAMIDGTYEVNDVFDINVNFKNFKNEPLTMLFQIWRQYPSLVFEGILNPYPDFIAENEFDYMTRIYVIITDETKRNIKKIAATGASFPVNPGIGKFFDYDQNSNYTEQTKEISVTFKSMGAIYNDDILFYTFNKSVSYFNMYARNYLAGFDMSSYIDVIPLELYDLLNYRGWPVIDMINYRLEWLIKKDDPVYQEVIKMTDSEIEEIKQQKNENESNDDYAFENYY